MMNRQTQDNSTVRTPQPLRVAVITCAVLELEVSHYRKAAPNLVHVEVMEQGLHNDPPKLRAELQKAIDKVEGAVACDAIVLGYGLCSRGVEGVKTSRCLLVVPRAHDCITILLGNKDRYAEYVKQHPGTYWYSPGWNKHHTPPGKDRYDKLYQKYLAQYGEDDAKFLMETEQAWFQHYDRATYVDLTVGATAQDIAYTRACADWLHWNFDHQQGDPALLVNLLAGRWDSKEVLVLKPGQTLTPTADERVIDVVPPGDTSK